MKSIIKSLILISYICIPNLMHAQEVVIVQVHDQEREEAENDAAQGYREVFLNLLLSQQKVLNYKRRLLVDNVIVTELQREALNSDMHINEEVIKLLEKNVQKLRERIDKIWQHYDRELMGNPEVAPIIQTYYDARKKQIFEDTELIDRKANAFIKGQGVESTIASPRQRMEFIRAIRKEYQQISGISLKQLNIFRTMIIGKLKQGAQEQKGGKP